MARAPRRTAKTYFVGAGLGSAFGIPNTQQLLEEVHSLAANENSWASTKRLGERLEEAYEYLYPIEKKADTGFRPNVVDFFSVIKTYSQVAKGLPGILAGTEELQLDLKKALANVLVNKMRAANPDIEKEQPELARILTPGNLVVTTNWDLLLERYAQLHQLPLRHRLQDSEHEVTLIKLHGSIDWCLRKDCRKTVTRSQYAALRERLFAGRPYGITPNARDKVVRITALENWDQSWSRIKSRAREPLMITMALGKAPDLEVLREQWRDAYGAISRARDLEVLGYSFPDDDIEIRTLLIAGIERGDREPRIKVRNPSPEVHDRFRSSVVRRFESRYTPVAARS